MKHLSAIKFIASKITVIGYCLLVIGITSCSDLLDSDSSRQVFDPEMNQKTDSIYYALGILQGVQQMADQYVLQGEMRGDLVDTTYYTDKNLRELYDFSATAANKYDSAYVYYRIINNCNYYIAHRDTTLRTGNDFVVMNEYAAVKALRAWTYMQLARTYGRVPFYTEPLTQISQIDNGNYPMLDLNAIVAALAPDLEQYSKRLPPDYAGVTPASSAFIARKAFIPVDIVLGEMYLEAGDYARAAQHYIVYLTDVASNNHTAYMQDYSQRRRAFGASDESELPTDWGVRNYNVAGAQSWATSIFSTVTSGYNDVISYIPMARNSSQGATTMLPLIFGYDFYSTTATYVDEIQLKASQPYLDLSNNATYYYISSASKDDNMIIKEAKLGDTRYRGITYERDDEETETTTTWITKYRMANILLYRNTTVLLHLAEALNRLGMYDAAFAILKDGVNKYMVDMGIGGPKYISDETKMALQTTYPLLANLSKFDGVTAYFGVHSHGAGYTRDYTGAAYQAGLSPYQLDTIVGLKMADIAKQYNVAVGATRQDSINAMEDLLCDEYALEFAFEGCRFYDLCRLARHKNADPLYGANFGSLWLASKLQFKNPKKDLTNPDNWYLPFN